jgi:hypothetical protein
MNRLAWTQVAFAPEKWTAAVIDFSDGMLFRASIEHDHTGYHATVSAEIDGNPKGATYRRCGSLHQAKAWVRRTIRTAE